MSGTGGNAGQLPLALETGRRHVGRIERRVADAIRAAKHSGALADEDDGACIVAVALGRAMDRAESIKPDPYATAAAARELREILDRLLLTPKSRGAGAGDPLEALLGMVGPDDPTAPEAEVVDE